MLASSSKQNIHTKIKRTTDFFFNRGELENWLEQVSYVCVPFFCPFGDEIQVFVPEHLNATCSSREIG